MADPIAQLQLYWLKLAADDADFLDYVAARDAMKDAITAGVYSSEERTRFAQANIFVEALTKQDGESALIDALKRQLQLAHSGEPDTRPVRAVMLNRIRQGSTGSSWYFLKVPGGVAPWITDAESTAPLFYETLTEDPSDEVLAEALNLMIEVNLPVAWVRYIMAHGGDRAIVQRVAQSGLPPDERQRLIGAVGSAIGSRVFASEVAPQLEASGTGGWIEVFPPVKPVPWYKRTGTGVAVAGVFGVLMGGALRLRRRK